ncbi:MAG: hypothetical protein SGJ21_03190 [Alphaproteobacteria bacterium]|nr:hypothetical protein [Alphaproteobacteria bacterium]
MRHLATIALLGAVTASVLPAAYADDRRSAGREFGAILQIAASEYLSQRSGVDIQQRGDNNQATATQNGPGNAAAIRQQGRGQSATVGQAGAVNRSDVSQYGVANRAAMNQTGSSNYACLIQIGIGLDADVQQSGSGRSVGIVQTPGGSREVAPEICFLEKVSWKYIAQRRGR